MFSFFSIFLFGVFALVGPGVYNNLSFAEIDLGDSVGSHSSSRRINLSLPKFDFKIKYNDYSVEEEKTSVPVPVEIPHNKKKPKPKKTKKTYYRPKVVENKNMVGMINGDESIAHYGFRTPDTTDLEEFSPNHYFESLNLEETLSGLEGTYSNESPEKADEISAIVSSQKKTIQKADDPVVYDYSSRASPKKIQQRPKKEKPPEISTKGKISNRVLDVIERELKQVEKESSKPKSFFLVKETALAPDSGSLSVRAYTAVLEKEMGTQVFNFEFIPDYNKTETFSSDEEGMMDIQVDSSNKGILRGRMIARGHMRTVVDLPLENRRDIEIPLMDEETFNRHLDHLSETQNHDDFYGGFVLVRMGEEMADANIDNEYSLRMFLDEEFQEVSREDDYSYILFLGVEAGNGVLSYLLNSGQMAEKIVHVPLDEILFDLGDVEKSRYKHFELYKRNIFSVETQEFHVRPEKIGYFNQDLDFASKGLNRYEFQGPPLTLGGRDYLRFDHLEGILYAGYRENNKLELPDEDFIESILLGFGIDELENACLIQFNFSKTPVDVQMTLNGDSQEEGYHLVYLDSDGTFHEAPSLKTLKAFVLGEAPGVFTGNIKYANGTTETLNSFCSMSSYLVEQL